MSKQYLDPPNTPEILSKLRELPTLGDVKNLVDKTFPKWIVALLIGYSEDYPTLTENWNSICESNNIKPTKVLIVDYLEFNDSHTLVKTLAELFTKAGFVVRRKNEFIPCSECDKAIPVQDLYHNLKKSQSIVPLEWSTKCSSC